MTVGRFAYSAQKFGMSELELGPDSKKPMQIYLASGIETGVKKRCETGERKEKQNGQNCYVIEMLRCWDSASPWLIDHVEFALFSMIFSDVLFIVLDTDEILSTGFSKGYPITYICNSRGVQLQKVRETEN